MNVQKSELKMKWSQDLGRQFEAREETLKAEANRLEGAQGALKQAAEKLEGIKAFYNREVDEDRVEEALLEPIVKAVDRCRGVLISLADVAQTQMLMKRGEAQEAKKSLDLIEKVFTDERDKLAAVLKGIEDGSINTENIGRSVDGSATLRVVDGRPTNDAAADLAARRAAARSDRGGEAEAAKPTSEAPAAEPQKAEATASRVPQTEVSATPSQPSETAAEPGPALPTPKRQVIQRRKK